MTAKGSEENVIFVGNKPPMSYVLAIEIGTESITNEEGRTSNVSSIEITLAK